MVISLRQKLQSLNDYTMNIHIGGAPINQSNQSKSLGLIIDENLSWKAHIHEISKKVSSGIGTIKQVRPFVSMYTAIKIHVYKGLIEPHFDWAIPENIHTQPRTASMFYPPLAFGNSKMCYPPHALRIP